MNSGWDWFAVFFGGCLLLVGFGAFYLLVRLGGLIAQSERSIDRVTTEALDTIRETTGVIGHVNAELDHVDAVAASVHAVTDNVSALTATISAVVGGPAVKAAAFSYGVRRAIGKRRAAEVAPVPATTRRRVRIRRGARR